VGVNKYEAFPAIGGAVGNGAGPIAYPLYSDYARFAAICAYDPAIYEGDFVVVSDALGGLTAGDVIKITKTSNTQFSFIYPYTTNAIPIVVSVNTLNNQLSITKQKIGDTFFGYTNPNVAVTASSSSIVAPCSKTITLAITYTVDQGSFGTNTLVLRKK
jgi:hypothetical protein